MTGTSASGDEVSADRVASHVGALLAGDGLLHRWFGPIRYRIQGLDDATRKILSQAFDQLGRATGLSVQETFDLRGNDLIVIFTDDAPYWANQEWTSKLFKREDEGDTGFVDRFARELAQGSRRWMLTARDGPIAAMVEIVYTPRMLPASTAIERNSRLARIAFEMLTLGRSSDFLPSLMNNHYAEAVPTPTDIAFVRALYDPEIGLNMSKLEAAPLIARKMAAQLR